MTLRSRLERSPLLGYFGLAYGISWGGILVVLSFTGFGLAKLRPLETDLIFIAMLLGPSTAGLALTALLDGRPGLRAIRSRLARWHVGARWYAIALLTMPVLMLAVVTRLKIPVYFIHGVYDYTVSYPLARSYYQRLEAPVKGFYTFKESAHSPLFEEPQRMREIMRADVLTGSTGLADPE